MITTQSEHSTPESRLSSQMEELDVHDAPRQILTQEQGYVYVEDGKYDQSKTVSIEQTTDWESKLLQDPKNRLAMSSFLSSNAQELIIQQSSKIAQTQKFNVKIPLEGAPVTNQNASGRCWLFAATNVFRVALMRKYNLKEFELSQAYLFFYDKLEKANYFLENMLDTADEPLESRLVQTLLHDPISDGGQWDMLANLVKKYGLVPQTLYPDSWNAKQSRVMDELIVTKLREDSLKLREMVNSKTASKSDISSTKAKFMQEIHLILTIMLGPPPKTTEEFSWEYYDKDDKFQSVTLDPIAFAAGLSSSEAIEANSGTDVNRLFSLVNDPRNEYGSHLTVSRLGNVAGGRGITYANVDMTTMKTACIDTLKAGIPIFFGCDVGKDSSNKLGIMDTALFDYDIAFNIKLGMTKEERLRAGASAMTHAMVLTAVHVIDGKPVRWRVENSWGEAQGSKGYFVMSDAWMDQWTYQAVVDPRFVSQEVKDILKKKPVVLPLWDPMGALA